MRKLSPVISHHEQIVAKNPLYRELCTPNMYRVRSYLNNVLVSVDVINIQCVYSDISS